MGPLECAAAAAWDTPVAALVCPGGRMPRSSFGDLGVRAGSVIDIVCSEPSGWSQNWVTSQTGTTTCLVCWDQVSFFLVKPSGAPRLLAACRLSFVLEFQEAKREVTQRAECPSSPPTLCTVVLPLPGPGPKGDPGAVGVRPAQPPPDLAKSCAGDWRVPPFPPPWVFPTCISADAGALVFCP